MIKEPILTFKGRSPGVENGNPLQYSCLENSMDKGDWKATVHGIERLDTTKPTEHTFVLRFSGKRWSC